jgi:glycosyltransferase involved in cell wall biosynthesis
LTDATGPSALHIAFGTIPADMPGGIAATEHVFQAALARTGRVVVHPLPFGSRTHGQGALARLGEGLADLARFSALVVRERPDLVHLDSAFDRRALVRDAGYALFARALGQRLFVKFHGSDPSLVATRSPWWRAVTALVFGACAGVGVLSGDERDALVAAGWPADKIAVVKNVVPWRRFARAPGDPAPARDPLAFLFLARLVPTKGLDDALRALALVRAAGKAATLDVVGDGPSRSGAEALARELGLGAAVRFHGQVPEAETVRFYATSGALVLPTEREGFSMTIFQAVAAGLPVLTTRVNAAKDWLREPDHVLWVRAHDPANVAGRVLELFANPEIAQRMFTEGPLVARTFDEDRVAAEYADLYTRCVRRTALLPPDSPLER